MALDIGFVNPQASGHLIRAAGGEATVTADDYSDKKRAHNDTDKKCEDVGIDYQPIVIQTTGGMSKEALSTLESLNRLVANNTQTPQKEVAHRFFQRLSIDMQRSLHRAVARRLGDNGFISVSAAGRALAEEGLLNEGEGGEEFAGGNGAP